MFAFSDSSLQVFFLSLIVEECGHRVQQIRFFDFHWHEHVFALRVCFSVSLRLTGSSANVAVRFSVEDFVVTRFFTEVASCISVRFSLLLDLQALGVIVVSDSSPLHFCVFLWFRCGFFLHIFRYFLCCRRRAGGMSIVVDFGFCGVSFSTPWFTSDQLCSASRRTLRAYTTPSSVRTRCSSVRSLLPSHMPDFHLSASFGAGFPDPCPTSGRCASTDSSNSSNFPRYGPPMAR